MAEYELTGVLQTDAQMNTELSLSASSGATDNYEMLKNRPSINGVVLSGDKSSAELNIVTADDVNKAVSNYAQPIGDYATNAQLAAEKMQREDADNAIYSKIADVGLLTSTYTASSITLTDAAQSSGFYSLKVYGNSIQDGTPTPEAPADIVSIGDSGSLSVTACGKNLFNNSLLVKKTDDSRYVEIASDGRLHLVNSSGEGFRTEATIELPEGEYIFARVNEEITVGSSAYTGFKVNNASVDYFTKTIEFTLTEKGTATVVMTTANLTTIGEYYTNVVIVRKGSTTDYEPYKGNTATTTQALPLCSVGDVCDELVFSADGTAKVIKRTKSFEVTESVAVQLYAAIGTYARVDVVLADRGQTNTANMFCNIMTPLVSYTRDELHCYCGGGSIHAFVPIAELETQGYAGAKKWLIDKGTKFVYPLAEPVEISLTAAEAQALLGLETYDILTNIINSENAQMSVKYWRNEDLGGLFTKISRNTNQRLTALEDAIINA